MVDFGRKFDPTLSISRVTWDLNWAMNQELGVRDQSAKLGSKS